MAFESYDQNTGDMVTYAHVGVCGSGQHLVHGAVQTGHGRGALRVLKGGGQGARRSRVLHLLETSLLGSVLLPLLLLLLHVKLAFCRAQRLAIGVKRVVGGAL